MEEGLVDIQSCGDREKAVTIKDPFLQVRQEINNRNCRVRASKTLTEQGLRRGEVSQDGSSLQNLDASKPRKGNHYPVSLPCAQSHIHTSTSPCQETCEKGGK